MILIMDSQLKIGLRIEFEFIILKIKKLKNKISEHLHIYINHHTRYNINNKSPK